MQKSQPVSRIPILFISRLVLVTHVKSKKRERFSIIFREPIGARLGQRNESAIGWPKTERAPIGWRENDGIPILTFSLLDFTCVTSTRRDISKSFASLYMLEFAVC